MEEKEEEEERLCCGPPLSAPHRAVASDLPAPMPGQVTVIRGVFGHAVGGQSMFFSRRAVCQCSDARDAVPPNPQPISPTTAMHVLLHV